MLDEKLPVVKGVLTINDTGEYFYKMFDIKIQQLLR